MKKIQISLIVLFLWSVISNASQPHYYSFNKVLLTEGEISIKASTKSKGELLEAFSINTSDGVINLDAETIKQVLNPKLNSIEMALMPYELEQGVRYFHEVSMKFYGEKICKPDADSLSGNWAPESKMVVVFWGTEHKVRFEIGRCNA
ncbi:hypothetical protein ACUR5C_00260 [Aliikangiella sp. IMCC44653]